MRRIAGVDGCKKQAGNNYEKPTAAFLFAGGGGDTEGAIRAEYQALWAVEYDKYAAAVYRYRFPDIRLIEADITTLTDKFIQSLSIPDVLIWGSPCPDFSIAGTRTGLEGDRGRLFFEGIRFLRILQPAFFLFENVEGLLDNQNGETFKKVVRAFGQLGYLGTWQLRNGNRHVPQNRARVFCVGVHRQRASAIAQVEQEIA